MIYASYDDYVNVYYGDAIQTEDDFIRYASRASDYLDRITMNRVSGYVEANPDDSAVKKAVCALADQYMMISYARASVTTSDGAIASESVGSHSVSYRSGIETGAALEAELKKIAEGYLLMTGLLYRGISNVHASYSYVDIG